MSIADCVSVIAVQANEESQTTSPPAATYVVYALLIVVMALVVWIFVRTMGRRGTKP